MVMYNIGDLAHLEPKPRLGPVSNNVPMYSQHQYPVECFPHDKLSEHTKEVSHTRTHTHVLFTTGENGFRPGIVVWYASRSEVVVQNLLVVEFLPRVLTSIFFK
jgi:hypothetical protein